MWNLLTRWSGGLFGDQKAPAEVPAAGDPAASRFRHHEIAEIEFINAIAVVTLTVEELSQQQGAVLLADLLDELVESGARYLVLDIQNVRYMDSACIGCMVEALNRVVHAGGGIALANPASGVSNLFRLTRLDRVFPICGDVLAAMNAVERGLRPQAVS